MFTEFSETEGPIRSPFATSGSDAQTTISCSDTLCRLPAALIGSTHKTEETYVELQACRGRSWNPRQTLQRSLPPTGTVQPPGYHPSAQFHLFTFPLPRDAFPPLSRTLWHILVFHSSGKLVQHLFPLPLQQALAHVCDSHCQGNVWAARSALT